MLGGVKIQPTTPFPVSCCQIKTVFFYVPYHAWFIFLNSGFTCKIRSVQFSLFIYLFIYFGCLPFNISLCQKMTDREHNLYFFYNKILPSSSTLKWILTTSYITVVRILSQYFLCPYGYGVFLFLFCFHHILFMPFDTVHWPSTH